MFYKHSCHTGKLCAAVVHPVIRLAPVTLVLHLCDVVAIRFCVTHFQYPDAKRLTQSASNFACSATLGKHPA